VINCDPDNPSGDLVSEANIEVVAMPAAVQSKLNRAVNSVEKANIYAEAGLWYNALDEALKLAQDSKLGEVGSTLLKELAMSEAPKTTSELSPKEREAIAKRIEKLKQIADSTR
jgi:purine-nucleoside phosphorylase